jgi:hypothetical protein
MAIALPYQLALIAGSSRMPASSDAEPEPAVEGAFRSEDNGYISGLRISVAVSTSR